MEYRNDKEKYFYLQNITKVTRFILLVALYLWKFGSSFLFYFYFLFLFLFYFLLKVLLLIVIFQ